MEKKRIEILDILKGIAIITVILVHVFRGKETLDILVGEVGRFAVPSFFMIQGYFMKHTSEKSWMQIFINKIKKVYLPFILFSFIYGLYFYTVDGKEFTLLDVLLGKTAVHLFFIIYYMIFSLIFPILYKMPYKLRNLFSWLMVIINFLVCLALEIQRSYGIRIITYSGLNPLKFCGFIALGMLFYEHKNVMNFIKNNRIKSIFLSTMITIIGIVLPFVTGTVGYMYNRSSLFPLAIGMTLLIISYFQGPTNPKLKSILSYIGQRSFGIYLIHFIITHFLKYILKIRLPWITVILTLLISLLMISVYKRLKIKLQR